MEHKKYIAMYYPNPWIDNRRSLSTFSLFFDEIHLVTISDMAIDPTSYLKNLPDKISISVIGEKPTEEETKRVAGFYQFAIDNRALIKEVIFYHPHLLDSQNKRITDKLLSKGGILTDDFNDFLIGNTPEFNAYNEFRKLHPEIDDEIILRVAPTALNLAKENDWILISDNINLPVPYLSEKIKQVRELTTIISEECIKIVLPQCIELSANDLLIVREKLKDLLIPFRMGMQKLTANLKSTIKEARTIEEVKSEAKFIAESQVEPALYELKRKIEIEKDKLILKIFGKVIGWIPFIAKAFLSPTPDQIYKSMVKVYGDIGTIAEGIKDVGIAKEPGLSFLLGIDTELSN